MRDEFVLGELGPETSKMGRGVLITLFHLICFKNHIYLFVWMWVCAGSHGYRREGSLWKLVLLYHMSPRD